MNCERAGTGVASSPARVLSAAGAALLCAIASPALAADPADTILVNGKIVTVDQRFTIAQGLAIRGQRIVAVGNNADVLELQGKGTKVIDLKKQTVIPGLIDNHAHFIRAPEHEELRLDGVASRKRALEMLTGRVRSARPGEWIVTLGGWSEEQFTDDPRGFPLDELDRIAPDNPVLLQAVYNQSYLNSAALKAAGIDAATPDPRGGRIEKDANGTPTGVVRNAGGVAFVAAKIPLPDGEQWIANVRKFVAGLNAMGITAWYDAGGRGMSEKHYAAYQALAERGELNARAFWTTIRQPATPEQVDKVLAEIQQHRPFQGNDYFENIGWGESLYQPATTNLLRNDFVVKPEDMREVRRIMQAIAESGMFLNAHVEMENAIDAYLAELEELNKIEPIKGLRWVLSHLPGERCAARAHEETRNVRGAAQPAAHPGRADAQGARRARVGHAAVQARAGQRDRLGARFGRDRGDDVQPLLYALVRRDRAHGRKPQGQPPDHLARRSAHRAHAQQRLLRLPGKQPRLDPARQVRGPAGARSRLPLGARPADQGHQAAHDDGGRKDRLPGQIDVA